MNTTAMKEIVSLDDKVTLALEINTSNRVLAGVREAMNHMAEESLGK